MDQFTNAITQHLNSKNQFYSQVLFKKFWPVAELPQVIHF